MLMPFLNSVDTVMICIFSKVSLLENELYDIPLYEGRLISNAYSEIFCQRSKVAIRAQCVLVATTLLHSGASFHFFLYTGSKTVSVNMESRYGGMSTRWKQRAVTEILSAGNVTPAEIHRRLQAVYGEKHC